MRENGEFLKHDEDARETVQRSCQKTELKNLTALG
jgi:hypothetical protein